ncbi:ABC transporter ATP-binding protein [Lacticaseibacillus thailandensis]|nr:ABC transporter ATP-binding protein [Lacticaseibacillus thailandensis]
MRNVGNMGGGRRPGTPRGVHVEVTINDWRGTVRRIWSYLVSKKWRLVGVFLMTVVTTAVTIVGNRINGIVVDTYIAKDNLRGLYIICLMLAGMYVVSSAFTYWQNATMIDVAQDTSARIRHDIFARLQRLPMRYFDTHDNGDVMSTLTNDVDNINTALMQTFVQLFTGIISVVGMLGAMIVLSPLLTVIVLLSTVMTYSFSRMAARVTQKAFTVQQAALGDLNSQIEESVSGKRAVQLFNHEAATLRHFASTNAEYTAAAYRAQLFSGAMGPFNNMTNNLAYLLITAAGAISIVSDRGGITVGVIFTFLIYLRNFTGPINNTLNLINTLQLSLASAERVFAVIDEQPEQDQPDAVAVTTTTGAVRFDHVSFAYVPGHEILHDINITAHPGDTVAIVGPTGAGKTTMMNLLTNLYPLQAGAVFLDGRDVTTIKRQNLRRLVTVVQQESHMFTASVADNIRNGRLDATDEEVQAAAVRAHADTFIRQLPQGYATVLTEDAAGLSQGQRQLLSIARAFVTNAPVLVLDEATSSIDSNTELDVQHAMADLMQGKTSFVIAHRLSTIQRATTIVVINGGRVVEQGTHAELLAAHGFYYQLYQSQFQHDIDKK